MEKLPIYTIIPEVKTHLLQHSTLIVQAAPGAGKSTVLPLTLLDEPWLKGKKIIMLEPRRLAAKTVANRMADLLKEEVGATVGYRIRFENRISTRTRIEVVTEGILTRMLQSDNSLEEVGLVIFDEFHERSIHSDLSLALCRQMKQLLRDDLRLLIMSATLDAAQLSVLLDNAPIVQCEGRQYPITTHYIDTDDRIPLSVSISRTIKKALADNEGDLLVFLPGTGDIHRTAELLEADNVSAIVVKLYGELSSREQQMAILPDSSGRRKIVLATSIAETSLTIEGIKIVVDSGYARLPRFDAKTGLSKLETVRITKDTANQRAGRAGRLGPGVCYRLWNEGVHLNLHAQRVPEILEADLTSLLLDLAQWGIRHHDELKWITPPSTPAVNQARELLMNLNALDEKGITAKGKEMLRLPTHPRIAHLLLEAMAYDEKETVKKWTALATDIAALLEERDFVSKEQGVDLGLRLEYLIKWRNKERVPVDRNMLERIERVAGMWRKTVQVNALQKPPVETDIGKLLAAAYPERIAKRIQEKDTRYRLTNGRIVKLQPHDPLSINEWLAVAHMDAGTNEGKIFLAAAIDPDDLLHLAEMREVVYWDKQKGCIVAAIETYIGNITIDSVPLKQINEEQRTPLLCNVIREEGLTILGWNEIHSSWQARILSLKKWRPDEHWPDVSNEILLATIEKWLAPFLAGITRREELKRIDLSGLLSGLLPYDLTVKLQSLAPDALKVPSGSVIPLTYFPDATPPELAVRLQEVFGLVETPCVNEGKTKITLHLLSPARRPVQVTQDLKSFWERTYAEVRKELRVRYPKHHWPEDPWTAEAVRGVKRKTS